MTTFSHTDSRLLALVLWGCLAAVRMGTAEAEAVPALVETSSTVTPAQRQWLDASVNARQKIGEEVAEAGARAWARENTLTPLFDGLEKQQSTATQQGFDQVWSNGDGLIYVIESKANSSPVNYPKYAKGYAQGTPECAVLSAERLLKSSKASVTQKEAAKAIIDAAQKGELITVVARTQHVLGEPVSTSVEVFSCTPVAQQLANEIAAALDDVARAVDAALTQRPSAPDSNTGSLKILSAGKTLSEKMGSIARFGSRALVVVGIGVEAKYRYDQHEEITEEYAAGLITSNERIAQETGNVAGAVGGWAGALGGAEACGVTGATIGSAFGPVGSALGGVGGALVGGVGGYFAGEFAAEHTAEAGVRLYTDRSSQEEE